MKLRLHAIPVKNQKKEQNHKENHFKANNQNFSIISLLFLEIRTQIRARTKDLL